MNERKFIPKTGLRLLDPKGKVIPPEGTMVPNSPQYRLLVREGSGKWADEQAAATKPADKGTK